MYFQKVLKGICDISRADAEEIVCHTGIISNWWRWKGHITNVEIKEELTEDNLMNHLNCYDDPLPAGHKWSGLAGAGTYGDVSAFISTTAGAVQRDAFRSTNVLFDPFLTALNFATSAGRKNGWIFYAYVVTLGKPAVPLQGFSEEVRELHIYQQFLRYHHEGELTAKISIPSIQIERAEYYKGVDALQEFRNGGKIRPADRIDNPDYEAPEFFNNIREVL